MSDAVLIALVGIGGTAFGYLGQILLARLSKSKKEKDVDLSVESLKTVGMSFEQLQKYIALVDQLDKDMAVVERENRKLRDEVETLKHQRKERDEHFEAIESHVSALHAQLEKDTRDREDLRRKLSEVDNKNRALWQYLIALLEHMRRNGLKPLDPPRELQSDPEIMRLIKGTSK